MMDIDFHAEAEQLLEMLANALYDRNPNFLNQALFTLSEIQMVERWLNEFRRKIKKSQ